MNNESLFNALKAAVEKIGGQSAMARLISTELRPIRQGHVWMWLNRNKKLPPEFVLAVESLTGVSRYSLRPDIFGLSPIVSGSFSFGGDWRACWGLCAGGGCGMSIRLTEAQLWLAHTPTQLPSDSSQVIAAILAEHRRFMAERARNPEITPALAPENPAQFAAGLQPNAFVSTLHKSYLVRRGRLAARLALLRRGAGQ